MSQIYPLGQVQIKTMKIKNPLKKLNSFSDALSDPAHGLLYRLLTRSKWLHLCSVEKSASH